MTDAAAAPESPATDSSTLDVRWVRKMVLMFLAAAVFSLWGLYDANVAYPKRGAEVADSHLRELLRIAEQDGKLDRVSTPEPVKEMERLGVGATPGNALEEAKLQWLEALRLIGRLKPEYTTISDPRARKAELDAEAAKNPGKAKPSPLSTYDIPAQWAIFGVCAALAAGLGFTFLRTKAKVYRWDGAERRLYLPGGASLVPSDIAEFDKRKWHKFYVTLRIRPEHATLGGKSLPLDLYSHAKLEGWVLEMEEASGLGVTSVTDSAAV